MKSRTEYLVQVIDKIGGPLLDAVTANSAKDPNATITKEQAEQLAVLLAKTVQLSITLGKMIEIEKTEPEMSDQLRVAMAGLASPIIASQYRHSSKVPSDDDMNKLSNALEAVMTFSDNFSPSPENAERLKNLQAFGQPADIHQTNIQYIQAFVPVADVITRFPFGQAEKKMVQDASEKITAKAKAIRQDIFGEFEDKDLQKIHELGIVKALADLYTQAHIQAMEKLMAIQEPAADAQSKALAELWSNFDTSAETLQTLTENIMPKKAAAAAASSGGGGGASPVAPPPVSAPAQTDAPAAPPPQAPQAAPPPQAPPTEQQQPATPPTQPTQPTSQGAPSIFQKPQSSEAPASPSPAAPQAPPAAPPAAPPQEQAPPPAAPPPQDGGQQAGGGNPMSMFAKPQNEGAPAAPPPQAPPATPPAQQTPPPTEPPPAPPAQESDQDGEQSGEQGSSGGGGPMSFFKTPPKGEGQ